MGQQKKIGRCYEKSGRSGASYLDCTVSSKFRRLSDFSRWCENQIGFKDVDDKGRKYQLDKDILSKGNKIYSPETSCFVPQEINSKNKQKIRVKAIVVFITTKYKLIFFDVKVKF